MLIVAKIMASLPMLTVLTLASFFRYSKTIVKLSNFCCSWFICLLIPTNFFGGVLRISSSSTSLRPSLRSSSNLSILLFADPPCARMLLNQFVKVLTCIFFQSSLLSALAIATVADLQEIFLLTSLASSNTGLHGMHAETVERWVDLVLTGVGVSTKMIHMLCAHAQL